MQPSLRCRFNTNVYNHGKDLEDKLYQRLVKIGCLTAICDEENLKRRWGWKAASVDYLIEVNGMSIPIQCKWRKSRRREDKGIYNFLYSIDYLKTKDMKPVLFGLWVSRVDPFDDNRLVLHDRQILCVSDFDSIDWLVDKAIETIVTKLRDHGVLLDVSSSDDSDSSV